MPPLDDHRLENWRLGDLAQLPAHVRHGHVLIGNFDGVHLGHRKMIDCTRALANRHDGPVVAVIVEPHSQMRPALSTFNRLTERGEKMRLLAELGVDESITVIINDDIAASPDTARNLERLWRYFEPKSIVMGANFHFGDHAICGEELAAVGRRSGLDVLILSSPVSNENVRITSEYIRSRLIQGDMGTVNHLLGRRWMLRGTVVHGDKRGRQLGFPTVNLAIRSDAHFAHGIYAVRLEINGKIAKGVASYGTRPQFDHGEPRLEVHIFDFDADLYGAELLVEFVAFQRSELVFSDMEALLQQMHVDCAEARQLLDSKITNAAIESVFDRRVQVT